MYLSIPVINHSLAIINHYRNNSAFDGFFELIDEIFELNEEVRSQFPDVFDQTNDRIKQIIQELTDMKDSIMGLTQTQPEYEAVDNIVYTIDQDYSHLNSTT